MSEPKPIHIVLILLGALLVVLFVVAQARAGRSRSGAAFDDLDRLAERWSQRFNRPALAHVKPAECLKPLGDRPLADGATVVLAPNAQCLLEFEESGLLPKSLRAASADPVEIIAKLQADEALELKLKPEPRDTTLSLGKESATLSLACRPIAPGNRPCSVRLGEPPEP